MADVTVRTDAPASPGAKLNLRIDQELVAGTRFHWTQVEGPPVKIDDPSQAAIQIMIPRGTDHLGFLLVAATPEMIRVFRVKVPIRRATDSWGARSPGRIRADAGDDQVGLVGHRVTLNGSRSLPGDGSTARWLKISGPSILEPQAQGPFFSFIPSESGTYRFVLLVAGDGAISEPDEVTVLVGMPPNEGRAQSAMTPGSNLPSMQPPSFEQSVSETIPRLAEGARIASDVADVMRSIADRAKLYSCFQELQSELTRRLDVVIPTDPAQRQMWVRTIFEPLGTYTAAELLPFGLDLRQPRSLQQPLNPSQQERIGEHFEKVARAFRADRMAR
jgi:hypothetical protein